MTNTYKSVSIVGEHYFGEGVSDLDLTPTEEQDAITGGHLEIVPRKYRVLSDNYSAGKQGDLVDLALLKELEAALVVGGHLERVDTPKPADKPAPKKKED